MSARCTQCHRVMTPGHHNRTEPTRASRDHILPRVWGGRDTMWGGVRNLRMMCSECNSRRAEVGHCVGALACVQSVMRDDLQDFATIIRRWGMRGMTVAKKPIRAMLKPISPEDHMDIITDVPAALEGAIAKASRDARRTGATQFVGLYLGCSITVSPPAGWPVQPDSPRGESISSGGVNRLPYTRACPPSLHASVPATSGAEVTSIRPGPQPAGAADYFSLQSIFA